MTPFRQSIAASMRKRSLASPVRVALRLGAGRGAVLAVAALLAAAPARAVDAGLAFDFDLSLSPKAAARLKASHEGITVRASFYGEPSHAGESHANEMGLVDLGADSFDIEGAPAPIHVGARGVDPAKLKWIKGPAHVNVNLYTTRRSGPDNLIDCDLIDGEVKKLQDRKVTVRCRLIGEPGDSRTFP